MNRREALIRVAGLMGGTLSASTLLAIDRGLAAGNGNAVTPSAATESSTLSAAQRELVSGVVDVMIPRTATPGALDVGVPQFIELMLKEVYTQADRDRYLAGLGEFEAAASSCTRAGAADRPGAQLPRHSDGRRTSIAQRTH